MTYRLKMDLQLGFPPEKTLQHFLQAAFLHAIKLFFRYHEMTIAKKSLERDNHGWIELEISDTVRNWMDGTSSNLGLVIKLIDDRGKDRIILLKCHK